MINWFDQNKEENASKNNTVNWCAPGFRLWGFGAL
jgi:hypothetical protein